MSSGEQRDQLAVHRLYYDYAWAIDSRPDGPDEDAVAACFTDDATFVNLGTEFHGRDAIRRSFAALKGPTRAVDRTMHFVTNVRVDVTGDEASATALLSSYVAARSDAVGGPRPVLRGLTYEARCRRVDDTWLFTRLVLTYVLGDAYPTLG